MTESQRKTTLESIGGKNSSKGLFVTSKQKWVTRDIKESLLYVITLFGCIGKGSHF